MKFFISYTRSDAKYAQQIYNLLQSISNIEVFLDTDSLHVGDKFSEIIYNKLEECRYFIPLLSSNSLASEWCQKEMRYFREMMKKEESKVIIPVFIETCNNYAVAEELKSTYGGLPLTNEGRLSWLKNWEDRDVWEVYEKIRTAIINLLKRDTTKKSSTNRNHAKNQNEYSKATIDQYLKYFGHSVSNLVPITKGNQLFPYFCAEQNIVYELFTVEKNNNNLTRFKERIQQIFCEIPIPDFRLYVLINYPEITSKEIETFYLQTLLLNEIEQFLLESGLEEIVYITQMNDSDFVAA